MKKEKKPKEKKEKKPKEKKPPKEKTKKPKKGKETPEGEEGQEPQKDSKLKLILLIVIAMIVGIAAGAVGFNMLFGGGKSSGKEEEKPIPAPTEYVIGEVTIPAIPVAEEEAETVLVYPVEIAVSAASAEEGEEAEEAGETEEAEESAEPQAVGYRYEGMTEVSAVIAEYVSTLKGKAAGMSIVDEALNQQHGEPDFATMESGSIYLARDFTDGEEVLFLEVDWTATGCIVELTTKPGQIEEYREQSFTYADAEDFIKGLKPEQLGLPGESMDAYKIYTLNGTVLVDKYPCIPFKVYENSETAGNDIIGNYFMAVDGSVLYQLDVETNTVTRLLTY